VCSGERDVVSTVLDMVGRSWDNFLARPRGSLNLRFIVQPTIAGLLALRAGIQDARQGRQGYLWAILSKPERRRQLLHEGWRGAQTPFLVAIVLDCIYQLVAVRFIYPLELLFTATLLALIRYILLRGPFNRIARLFLPPAGAPPRENCTPRTRLRCSAPLASARCSRTSRDFQRTGRRILPPL
jgi:hypothetical protein